MEVITRPFVHLHCHSHYSLLDGASPVKKLVSRAKELGMNALALTDHGNLYGALEFYKACKEQGINPIVGYEAYIAPGSRFNKEGATRSKEAAYHLTLLAKNRAGFRNLVKMASRAYLEGFYHKPRIDKELLEAHNEGIICLSGCVSGELSKHLLSGASADEAMARGAEVGIAHRRELRANPTVANRHALGTLDRAGVIRRREHQLPAGSQHAIALRHGARAIFGKDVLERLYECDVVEARVRERKCARVRAGHVEGNLVVGRDALPHRKRLRNQVDADGVETEPIERHHVEAPRRSDVEHALPLRSIEVTVHFRKASHHHVSTRTRAQVPVSQ